MDYMYVGVWKVGKDNIVNLVCLFIFFKYISELSNFNEII